MFRWLLGCAARSFGPLPPCKFHLSLFAASNVLFSGVEGYADAAPARVRPAREDGHATAARPPPHVRPPQEHRRPDEGLRTGTPI